MDIRILEPAYSVSPQISVEDVAAIADAGFRVVICNRPDNEVPPEQQAAAIGAAVEEAGLRFIVNPVVPGAISDENLTEQANGMNATDGPTLAYCASGNRSSIVWSFIRVPELGVDTVLAATTAAGYRHDPFRPHLEMVAANQKG